MLRITDLRGAMVSLAETVPRAQQNISTTEEAVTHIVHQVRQAGVNALLDLSEHYDGVRPEQLRVPESILSQALDGLDPEVRGALEVLIQRAGEVHSAQLPAASMVSPASQARITNRWVPVDRVGLYVPGGQAVYPSSVVMNVVPAQVAGVESLAIASPPQKDFNGWPHPTILAAAQLLGVKEVYAVGGAQAIAMFAYGAHDEQGTEVVPPVRLITGPGNVFVTTAKRLVRSVVGIDAEAGPTEVMVLADQTADPRLVAADLVSQAEHDELAAAVLVTDSMDLAQRVVDQVQAQAAATVHAQRVEQALRGEQSAVLVVESMDQAVQIANNYGAEHLEVMTEDDESIVDHTTNAGAVFMGAYTPVSLGDYCAGSNHVLPTGGASAYSSGLNVTSFLRSQQVIHYSRAALEEVGPHVQALATAEGLPAHGDAMTARFT